MYVCAHYKKRCHLCRLKTNHSSELDTCVYSWLIGLHGCEQVLMKLLGLLSASHGLTSLNSKVEVVRDGVSEVEKGRWEMKIGRESEK